MGSVNTAIVDDKIFVIRKGVETLRHKLSGHRWEEKAGQCQAFELSVVNNVFTTNILVNAYTCSCGAIGFSNQWTGATLNGEEP